jgi:hypothetical protein
VAKATLELRASRMESIVEQYRHFYSSDNRRLLAIFTCQKSKHCLCI